MADDATPPSWYLGDAEALAKAFPYTFWKPSAQLVAMLKAGDLVKLIFERKDHGGAFPQSERMWVEITGRTTRGFTGFIGRLANDPSHIRDLRMGDIITFAASHIINSNVEDPVPDPTLKWQAHCVASRCVLEGGRADFIWREEPWGEEDSGWRFMRGDESQAYAEDPANRQVYTLGSVLSADDRMVDLLDRPAPVAFSWSEEDGKFVDITPKRDSTDIA